MDRMTVVAILAEVPNAFDIVIQGKGDKAILSCSVTREKFVKLDFNKWRIVNDMTIHRTPDCIRIRWIGEIP